MLPLRAGKTSRDSRTQSDRTERKAPVSRGKPGPAPRTSKPVRGPVLSEKIKETVTSIDDLKKNRKGFFFDGSEVSVKEFETGEILNALGELEKDAVNTIVFGGVISQRLVNAAAEKGVKKIIGVRTHDVKDIPTALKIVTTIGKA